MVDRVIRVRASHGALVQGDPEKMQAIVRAATDFRFFLKHWHFIDQESKRDRILGDALWPGQQKFVKAMDESNWLFTLKARKLGFTTIEEAYDGWVARFGDPFSRVHLFSRKETAAIELLDAVKYGLRHLPDWMQLDVGPTDSKTEFTLDASAFEEQDGEMVWVEDIRKIISYTTTENTSVEATCNHGHVDEWAKMRNPRKVWQSIEPTMAGTCHIITTGEGPQNYTSEFWRACMRNDEIDRLGDPIRPFFVDALQRPGRDEAWLRAKYRGDRRTAMQEYPRTWEDALSGGGEYVFDSNDLDKVGQDTLGPQVGPRPGRKYLQAWDIGRHEDAAVGIIYDITDPVHDVVAYYRFRELSYPALQWKIEQAHHKWKGRTWIEKNAAGEAVMENLNLSPEQVDGVTVTHASKPKMIEMVEHGLQSETIKWDPEAFAELDSEVRGYQLPDDDLVQDSFMALALAEYAAVQRPRRGRVMGVMQV